MKLVPRIRIPLNAGIAGLDALLESTPVEISTKPANGNPKTLRRRKERKKSKGGPRKSKR